MVARHRCAVCLPATNSVSGLFLNSEIALLNVRAYVIANYNRRMLREFLHHLVGFCLLFILVCTSSAQADPDVETVHPGLRVEVQGLPALVATDVNASSISKAVSIALSGLKLSCAPDSEVEKVIESSDGSSLATLVSRISGTTCTSKWQTHKMVAMYVPNGEIQGDALIASIMQGKPLVLEKPGGVYVLYGAIYDEHLHLSGRRDNVIRQLLLIDPRYSDHRRFTSFVRGKDEFSGITGVANITAK